MKTKKLRTMLDYSVTHKPTGEAVSALLKAGWVAYTGVGKMDGPKQLTLTTKGERQKKKIQKFKFSRENRRATATV